MNLCFFVAVSASGWKKPDKTGICQKRSGKDIRHRSKLKICADNRKQRIALSKGQCAACFAEFRRAAADRHDPYHTDCILSAHHLPAGIRITVPSFFRILRDYSAQ